MKFHIAPLLTLVLVFFPACKDERNLEDLDKVSISELRANDELEIRYQSNGHVSRKATLVFNTNSVQVDKNGKLELSATEIASLDNYFLNVETGSPYGRCSIQVEMRITLKRQGKKAAIKTIKDDACLWGLGNEGISIEGILSYLESESDIPGWRENEPQSSIKKKP